MLLAGIFIGLIVGAPFFVALGIHWERERNPKRLLFVMAAEAREDSQRAGDDVADKLRFEVRH